MQQPMQHPQGGAPQQGGAGQSEPEALRNLMVNYIPTTIDEMQMRQLFEMYGPIESVKIVSDRETRQSKGYGFVKYRFAFSAMHAIQYLNGYPLMNKRLKVAYANAAEASKAAQSPETNQYAAQAQVAMSMQGGGGQPQQGGGDPQQQQQAYMQQVAAMQMMQQQQMMMSQQQQQQQQGAGGGGAPHQ